MQSQEMRSKYNLRSNEFHLGEERGLTRIEVHGVKTTLGLVVDAVPVEGIIALVDLTRLAVVLTHEIGQREARGTHERLFASRFVDLVELAIHTCFYCSQSVS